jgi:pilus assembly protein Flp/PilA
MVIDSVRAWLNSLLHRDNHVEVGQGLVEYALILILVAVVVVVIAAVLGPGIGNIYSNLVSQM